nr:unnamed protein product [uncultured Mediterranean phage uvMED]
MALFSRSRLIQTKIESSYGTDPTPAGTDAVLVRNLDVSPIEAETVSRDLIRSYMGNSDQLLANTRVAINFEAEFAGSGTAGTASRLDSLLRACGFTASTTGSAVTGSSQAGSAGSITLASGANANDDYYNGMVITITSGTGNGHKGLIVDYNGTSKVATVKASTATFVPGSSSGYSIAANVGYLPRSTGFESTTIYFNNSGVLHKATGCRGSVSMSLEVGSIPVFNFSMTGIYNAPTDTALPSTTYSNQTTPVLFKAGNTVAASFLDYDTAAISSISMDMANEIVYRELVGADKSVLLTNRTPSGTAVLEAPTMAQKDFFTIANADTTGKICFQHGTTAGNIVSVLAPVCDIGNPTYSDDQGIQMLNLPFVPTPSATGNDEVKLVFC